MSAELELLVQLGRDGAATKYYALATATILFYDYFLTLGDEIKYAWRRKKSWVFWLFLVNRYFPMTYQFWLLSITYSPNFNMKVCQKTAWYHIFTFVVCSFVAQVVLTLRIYAVTTKSVPIAFGFAALTVSQFVFGVYILVRAGMEGAEVPQLQIPLDGYHLCIFVPHRALEVTYTTLSLLYDSVAFTVIIFFALKSGTEELRIPTLFATIAEDAMRYFLVIFTSHFVFEMTLAFGRETIRFLPGPGLVVYLPVMISRLLLSLRKAADEHQKYWSLMEPTLAGVSFKGTRLPSTRRDPDPGSGNVIILQESAAAGRRQGG